METMFMQNLEGQTKSIVVFLKLAYLFIQCIFYMDIFKCVLQHFVGGFARLLYGALHNLFNVTSRIHWGPQNKMSDIRPQGWELHALLFRNSAWVL